MLEDSLSLGFLSTHTERFLLLQFLRKGEREEGEREEGRGRGMKGEREGGEGSLAQLLTEALHHAFTFRARSLSVVSTTETALA